MCCNREHYPHETGLWQTDPIAAHYHLNNDASEEHNRDDHLHLVLPNNRICVCVWAGETECCFKAEDMVSHHYLKLRINYPYPPRFELPPGCTYKLRDLLAISIAETGRISCLTLSEIIKAFCDKEKITDLTGTNFMTMVGNLHVEPTALEYHEWLVQVAQREALAHSRRFHERD